MKFPAGEMLGNCIDYCRALYVVPQPNRVCGTAYIYARGRARHVRSMSNYDSRSVWAAGSRIVLQRTPECCSHCMQQGDTIQRLSATQRAEGMT
jgi:hypothetical protein